MARQLIFCFVLSIFTILTSSKLFVNAQPQVPCYFVFGDSIVDNGNNNNLKTTAKANYFPYGVDFPRGPTGRFTNGRNPADFIAEYLGFQKYISPYANVNTTGRDILNGVNYASGAAGIRKETGQHLGDRICLDRQLQNHQRVVSHIGTLLGSNTTNYLKKCIYLVNIGSNDYINNFFMPKYYNTSIRYSPTKYATALTNKYSQQLRSMYNLGARKIAVFGVSLLGCMPFENDHTDLALGCSTEANKDSQLFTNMLPPLIHSLNTNLTDARFIYINYTHISLTPVPRTGIIHLSIPCCVPSTTLAAGQCQPNKTPCKTRTTHAFFDKFHPTERAYELEAKRAYSALTPSDAIPYDIKTLAQIQL